MPDSFFDSNVLLYTTSKDPAKAQAARALIDGGGSISVQVLNEVTNVARRKFGLPWKQTRSLLTSIRALLVVEPLTIEVHETGLRLAERCGLSVFDAMIAASALHAGCTTLWSEDMQDGMELGRGLRIRNPFKASPSPRRR